MLSELNKTVKI